MPDPRRNYRPDHEPATREHERPTTRTAPMQAVERPLRDTQPDGLRPPRRALKSGVRARRSRNAVTEIDASSHHNDPRRERDDD